MVKGKDTKAESDQSSGTSFDTPFKKEIASTFTCLSTKYLYRI